MKASGMYILIRDTAGDSKYGVMAASTRVTGRTIRPTVVED
jgi:hypothetical protein